MKEYHLDIGNNLISYPFEISQTIENAIPNQYLDNILAISNDGMSLISGSMRYEIWGVEGEIAFKWSPTISMLDLWSICES